jgi:hypothetical protein
VAGRVRVISTAWCGITASPCPLPGAPGGWGSRVWMCSWWQERVEGLPSGHRQVGGRGRGGVLRGSAGRASAAARRREAAEVVDRHPQRAGPVDRSSRWPGISIQVPPGASGASSGTGAAVAAPGLGDALDLIHRPGSEVADVQQLHDGPGRTADGSAGRRALRRCRGRGEDAGVDQAAGVDGQLAAQPGQLAGGGGVSRAGQSTACGRRHQLLPSPAGWATPELTCQRQETGTLAAGSSAGWRRTGRWSVRPGTTRSGCRTRGSGRSGRSAAAGWDAVGGHLQGTARAVGEGAAVPVAGGGRCGAHAREPARRHAASGAALAPDPPSGRMQGNGSANERSRVRGSRRFG